MDIPDGTQFTGYAVELETGDSDLRIVIYVGSEAFPEVEPELSEKLTIDGVLLGLYDGVIVLRDGKILSVG